MTTTQLDITGANGVRLAATWHRADASAGRPDMDDARPVVVAVHGYPDDSSVWDALVPHLLPHADVLTYDVRGCGRSEAPTSRAGYDLDLVAADLDAVVRHAAITAGAADEGERQVHVLAHDWGSIQAWQAVTGDGDTTHAASFTSLSGPCLDHVERWMRASTRAGVRTRRQLARQLASSAYIAFFRVPMLPELAVRSGVLPFVLTHSRDGRAQARAGRPAPKSRDMLAGLGLYRTNMLPTAPLAPKPRTTRVPTLVIVNSRDAYVTPPLATAARDYVDDLDVATVDAGHWSIVTHPGEVAARVLPHIDAHTRP